MEEENEQQEPAEELLAGKFKSVDALVRAYGELEAEFTRRSQRLKALEGEERKGARPVMDGEELYQAVSSDEGVKARVLGDYLASLKGVPLLSGAGVGVTAPPAAPKNIREAGAYALGYFRNNKS